MLACNFYAMSACPRAQNVTPYSAKVLAPVKLAARGTLTQRSLTPFSVPPIITRNLSFSLLEQTPQRENSLINNNSGLRYHSQYENKESALFIPSINNDFTKKETGQILKPALPPNIPLSQAPKTFLTSDDWHQFFQNYTKQSMDLNPIRVQIQDQFTDEIDQLRQMCFPSIQPIDSAKDLFEERSKQIVVMIDNVLVAYGRLTPGPNAVFENWTRGQAKIPVGEHVIDLGRCLVNPQFRGLGLLELVFIVALMYAKKTHFKYIVGTVLPSETVGVKTAKYGFIDSGGLVYREAPNQSNILVQPIVCEIEKAQPLWDDRIEQQLAFLASKGYRL